MSDDNDYESKAVKCPPTSKGNRDSLKKFIDSKITYDAPDRELDCSRWRRADLYDRGWQWIKPAFKHVGAGNPTQFVRMKYDPNKVGSIPTPVFNEGLGIRQNETARLGRPEYKPFVRPSGENPSIKVRLGAKKGKDVLLYELDRMEFDKQEDLVYWHMPAYGDATLVSRWEQTWDKTTVVPVEGAMSCPRKPGADVPLQPVDLAGPDGAAAAGLAGAVPPVQEPCDFTLASPKVSRGHAVKFGITDPNDIEPRAEYDTFLCPQCEDHPELAPFKPNPQEANGQDSIGRPLGNPQPLGEWSVKIHSPYDTYLENGGIDIDPSDMREITLCHVESLDWVAMRYPEKAASVRAENPAKLMEYHPHGGAPELYQAAGTAKLFGDHVRVKEYHRKPTMVLDEQAQAYKMDRGRSIVMAGEQVLLDGDLLIDNLNKPGTTVERIEWVLIPWEILEGGRLARGLSLWDIMADAQDIINTNESMTQATNRRCAVPTYYGRKLMNLEVGALDGSPGRWVFGDTDPLAPNAVPEVFNNFTIDKGIAENTANAVQYLQRAGGKADVEGGNVPPGVAAATAIAQLLEQSAEHRKPRIRRIRSGLKKLWSHGLRLIAALWIEPREYRYESEDGEEKWAALHGLDLQGQTDVDLEPEPISDSPDIRRENVRDLINLKVIQPGVDPAMDRRIAKALDAPSEFYVDSDVQETAAQREYEDFVERGKSPVMNPSMDEHGTHYQEHGRAAQSERFRSMAEQASWPAALEILSGDWDNFLRLVATIPTPLAGGPPALPGMLPLGQIPPPIQSIQRRIKDGWIQRLTMGQFQPQDPKAFAQVVEWFAHTEAHKIYAELKATMMQPAMPAPTGDEAGNAAVAA